MQNPKISMSMQSYTYVLYCSSLEKTSFLDYSDSVNPAATSTPTDIIYLETIFNFSVLVSRGAVSGNPGLF